MAQQCQNPDTYQVKIVKYSDNLRRMILQINPHSIACSYKETFEQHSINALLSSDNEFDLFRNDDLSASGIFTSTDDQFHSTVKSDSTESSKRSSPLYCDDTMKLCAERPCAEGVSCGRDAYFLNQILKHRVVCRHHDNCQHGVTNWPTDDATGRRDTSQCHWTDDIIRELSAVDQEKPHINCQELALKMTASDAEVYKLLKTFRDRKSERRPSSLNMTDFYKSIAMNLKSPCEADFCGWKVHKKGHIADLDQNLLVEPQFICTETGEPVPVTRKPLKLSVREPNAAPAYGLNLLASSEHRLYDAKPRPPFSHLRNTSLAQKKTASARLTSFERSAAQRQMRRDRRSSCIELNCDNHNNQQSMLPRNRNESSPRYDQLLDKYKRALRLPGDAVPPIDVTRSCYEDTEQACSRNIAAARLSTSTELRQWMTEQWHVESSRTQRASDTDSDDDTADVTERHIDHHASVVNCNNSAVGNKCHTTKGKPSKKKQRRRKYTAKDRKTPVRDVSDECAAPQNSRLKSQKVPDVCHVVCDAMPLDVHPKHLDEEFRCDLADEFHCNLDSSDSLSDDCLRSIHANGRLLTPHAVCNTPSVDPWAHETICNEKSSGMAASQATTRLSARGKSGRSRDDNTFEQLEEASLTKASLFSCLKDMSGQEARQLLAGNLVKGSEKGANNESTNCSSSQPLTAAGSVDDAGLDQESAIVGASSQHDVTRYAAYRTEVGRSMQSGEASKISPLQTRASDSALAKQSVFSSCLAQQHQISPTAGTSSRSQLQPAGASATSRLTRPGLKDNTQLAVSDCSLLPDIRNLSVSGVLTERSCRDKEHRESTRSGTYSARLPTRPRHQKNYQPPPVLTYLKDTTAKNAAVGDATAAPGRRHVNLTNNPSKDDVSDRKTAANRQARDARYGLAGDIPEYRDYARTEMRGGNGRKLHVSRLGDNIKFNARAPTHQVTSQRHKYAGPSSAMDLPLFNERHVSRRAANQTMWSPDLLRRQPTPSVKGDPVLRRRIAWLIGETKKLSRKNPK